jgi:hypothetical protein
MKYLSRSKDTPLSSYVLDKVFYRLYLIEVKQDRQGESTIWSHGNDDDLLKGVSFDLDKYFIDKELQLTDDFMYINNISTNFQLYYYDQRNIRLDSINIQNHKEFEIK